MKRFLIPLAVLLAPALAAANVKLIGTPELAAKLERGAVVLVDTRTEVEFSEAHIPGAVLVPAKQTTAKLPAHAKKDQLVVFYCNGPDCTKSRKALKAAASAGYTLVREYNEGLPAWKAAGKKVNGTPLPPFEAKAIAPREALGLLQGANAPFVVDIRDADEFAAFHLKGARSIPLDELKKRIAELPDGPILIADHSGHQAKLGARVLASLGRKDLRSIAGGLLAWTDADLPIVEQ